jgi:hypothetical protein
LPSSRAQQNPAQYVVRLIDLNPERAARSAPRAFFRPRKTSVPDPDEFRRFAEDCITAANSTEDPNMRKRLLEMAQHWHELASTVDAVERAKQPKP